MTKQEHDLILDFLGDIEFIFRDLVEKLDEKILARTRSFGIAVNRLNNQIKKEKRKKKKP